jgi:hypothetical protein
VSLLCLQVISGSQRYLQRRRDRHKYTMVRASALVGPNGCEAVRKWQFKLILLKPFGSALYELQVSNRRRTTWYSLLEMAVLLLVTGAQIFAITYFFNSTHSKRANKLSV